MRRCCPLRLVKTVRWETGLLAGVSDPAEAALRLTMGILWRNHFSSRAPLSHRAKRPRTCLSGPCGDTTGAGDAFWGGSCTVLLRGPHRTA
jgi:hypothetical protein